MVLGRELDSQVDILTSSIDLEVFLGCGGSKIELCFHLPLGEARVLDIGSRTRGQNIGARDRFQARFPRARSGRQLDSEEIIDFTKSYTKYLDVLLTTNSVKEASTNLIYTEADRGFLSLARTSFRRRTLGRGTSVLDLGTISFLDGLGDTTRSFFLQNQG